MRNLFVPKMLARYGKMPAGTLRDPYCLGFLQIVGVYIASQSLEEGSGMDKAKAVFEEALSLTSGSLRVRPEDDGLALLLIAALPRAAFPVRVAVVPAAPEAVPDIVSVRAGRRKVAHNRSGGRRCEGA